MIRNDQELAAMWKRISWFQGQVALLRQQETNPDNYHASASGFLSEIARMQTEVREYFSVHPREIEASTK